MTNRVSDINNPRLAVLIDADNAPRDCLKSVMEEVAIYGTPTIKRIYGDWTSPNVGGWKGSLLENAVTPIQQYGYTTGKNSTDSAMIIDAMDILYSGKTDGFVLVSSDSDFTRLAIRLREAGMRVIGIGERKTPSPFIVACDKFVYIEVIRDRYNKEKVQEQAKAAAIAPKKTNAKPAVSADKASARMIPDSIVALIADSVADIADDDGFCDMSYLGNLLIKKQPDFDSRNFGFGKLSSMIKAMPRFELVLNPTADPSNRIMYIKDKEA
ncbi:MAG: Maebl [Firmicutes bacterium HGW-Firmicutes-16]|nr:MAG: Maebl [Firmicutes bacterium HGW-Firmicutes-16]